MANGITRKTFDEAPDETKLNVLFDLTMELKKSVEKLKGRRITHGLIQFSGSLIGGAMIILAYMKWFAPVAKAGGAG